MANIKTNRIFFHFLATRFALPSRSFLKDFIINVFKSEKTAFETITYVFCDDEYLRTINKDFLFHDYYTDIITFNLAENKKPVIGEIYISIDRVRENATTHQQPFSRELRRVMFHGALHLCGYKDKTRQEIFSMRQKEDYYLGTYKNKPL